MGEDAAQPFNHRTARRGSSARAGRVRAWSHFEGTQGGSWVLRPTPSVPPSNTRRIACAAKDGPLAPAGISESGFLSGTGGFRVDCTWSARAPPSGNPAVSKAGQVPGRITHTPGPGRGGPTCRLPSRRPSGQNTPVLPAAVSRSISRPIPRRPRAPVSPLSPHHPGLPWSCPPGFPAPVSREPLPTAPQLPVLFP